MDHELLFNTSGRAKKRLALLWSLALIVLVLTVGIIARIYSPALLPESEVSKLEFENYLEVYSKSYSSDEEYQKRFKIFQQNSELIRKHNQGNNDWYLGINKFADMSTEELSSIYLSHKYEREIQRDFIKSETNFTGPEKSFEIPSSIDWRTKGAVNYVKDQGNCGSCWAFSAIGAIESIWKISGHPLVSLSEQQLMDCSYANFGCYGGWTDDAFDYIIKNEGVANQTVYPYKAKNGSCDKTKAKQITARITGYKYVTSRNETALLAAIANQPVAVYVEADYWFFYFGGIVNRNCNTNLNHGVLVVGYNTTSSIPYYIVKNSWGTDWGRSGYIKIAITSGNGICGIQISPMYPTITK
jgi:KDEL-tailed cysteine endopeptidase